MHHVAIATKDLAATHAFYTEAMGFELVKVVTGPTEGGGWSKHLFYDTGDGGLIAFWDLHDESLGDFKVEVSTGLGLPVWVNHYAFTARSLDELAVARDRWLAYGITVPEIDHGFCTSIYATDPNGILVEWCCDTGGITAADKEAAQRLLHDPNPPLEPNAPMKIHRAKKAAAPV